MQSSAHLWLNLDIQTFQISNASYIALFLMNLYETYLKLFCLNVQFYVPLQYMRIHHKVIHLKFPYSNHSAQHFDSAISHWFLQDMFLRSYPFLNVQYHLYPDESLQSYHLPFSYLNSESS